MTWVALKSLVERRTRAVLTALAIVLGVAMIAGSFILTDTIDRAFTTIFSSSYTQTDLVVRGKPVVADSMRGRPHGPRVAPARRSRALPGVAAASGGSLVDFSGTGNNAKLIDRGRQGHHAATTRASASASTRPSRASTPSTLAEGSWAAGPGPGRHRRQHRRGQRLRRRRPGRASRRTAPSAPSPSPVSPASATSTPSAARRSRSSTSRPPARCSARPASTPSRSPTKPGVSPARGGAGASRPLLPATAEVKTGDEQARSDQAGRLGVHHVHPRLPARVRRDRAVRGRLRDLQHPLDHRGPALAGAGHAAHPRRLAPAGAPLGDRRGRHHRPRGLAGRARARLRPGQGAVGASSAASGPTCRRRDTVFETRTVVVSLVVGTVDHPAGRRHPGHPGDPGPPDRRRPRGRRAGRRARVARSAAVRARSRSASRPRCWCTG